MYLEFQVERYFVAKGRLFFYELQNGYYFEVSSHISSTYIHVLNSHISFYVFIISG